jgi:hypothetical protein
MKAEERERERERIREGKGKKQTNKQITTHPIQFE